MPKLINMVGCKIGRLTVIEFVRGKDKGKHKWKCLCDCGNTTVVWTCNLRKKRNPTQSCGCLWREMMSRTKRTHGLSGTKEYKRLMQNRRDALKHSTMVEFISVDQIRDRMRKFEDRCLYCGDPYKHIDHFIPLSRGGKHVLDNLVPACAFCNSSKNNKVYPSEWISPKYKYYKLRKAIYRAFEAMGRSKIEREAKRLLQEGLE